MAPDSGQVRCVRMVNAVAAAVSLTSAMLHFRLRPAVWGGTIPSLTVTYDETNAYLLTLVLAYNRRAAKKGLVSCDTA